MKTRKTNPSQFLLDTIALCPPLAERMHGDRHILLGDAFTFVDPVFSSGVMLTMNSAFLGADAVDASLREPAKATAEFRKFDTAVREGVKEFSWFIYRMTNPTIRDMFMGPSNRLRMEEALLSLLAGDLFRGTPIHWSLRAFKVVYYLSNISHPLRSFKAWRRRRQLIRDLLNESAAAA